MAEKNWRNLWGFLSERKNVPAVGKFDETTRSGIQKAFIPKFLYKPPFGYPRYVDLPTIRRLATVPYVDMCITTIIDEACSIKWDITPIEGKETESTQEHIDHVKSFYDNPNTNKESFTQIRRKYLRDILEVDAGVINKVFNQAGEMVEIVARAGDTFTKNPDIYGMFTDRDDIILDQIIPTKFPKENLALDINPLYLSTSEARERAAYFQYGWVSGARPVPFGKKEIVWLERNPRTDSIYGRSPVQILAETIQTLIYAIEHNLEYFNDNSIPKGVLGFDGSNAEELDALKEQWEQQQKKQDSDGNWKKDFHRIPMMGRVPVFTRLQFSNAELELLEGQKWWAKLVWACFGVTSVELGYTEDSKGLANQIVQSNVFKKRALNPLLRLEEYHHNKEIISEFGYDDVEFKFLQFDVEEEMKKADLYARQIQAGYKSINEVRVEEGLEEVSWGEKMSEEDRLIMNQKFGNVSGENNNQQGSAGKEEDNEKKKVQKDKQNLTGKKSIETKPFGEYEDFDACVIANKGKKNPEAYCASLHKNITGKWPSQKSWQSNPLILSPNEKIDEQVLERAMVYMLRENKDKIIELIKREVGKNTIKEIKSVDDIANSIKIILNFEGIREISNTVIKSVFMDGWDSAEKQLERNFMVNNNAIDYIQNYTFENIKGMNEEIAQDLRAELQRGIMQGEGATKLTERVKSIFDKMENRAEAIARTETNRAENIGKLQAFKSSGVKLKKKWIATMDERTSEICKRLNGKTVNIDDNFIDRKTGWEGQSPPSHVNCRSTLVYFTEESEKKD